MVLVNVARVLLAVSAGYLLMNDRRFRRLIDTRAPKNVKKAIDRVVPHPTEAKSQRTATETARRAGREAQDFMAP